MPNGNLSYRNNKSTISQRDNSRMSSAASQNTSRSGSAKSLNFEQRKREVVKIKEENY
jgi:hypothetical protein